MCSHDRTGGGNCSHLTAIYFTRCKLDYNLILGLPELLSLCSRYLKGNIVCYSLMKIIMHINGCKPYLGRLHTDFDLFRYEVLGLGTLDKAVK